VESAVKVNGNIGQDIGTLTMKVKTTLASSKKDKNQKMVGAKTGDKSLKPRRKVSSLQIPSIRNSRKGISNRVITTPQDATGLRLHFEKARVNNSQCKATQSHSMSHWTEESSTMTKILKTQ
jgi:hypothetical protein